MSIINSIFDFQPAHLPEAGPLKIALLGLSLEYYDEKLPDLIGVLREQLSNRVRFPGIEIVHSALCLKASDLDTALESAKESEAEVILLRPMSYLSSGTWIEALRNSRLPIVVWNTQELESIGEDFTYDDLLANHVVQGTQDLTHELCRHGVAHGLVSGHVSNDKACRKLVEQLRVAVAYRYLSRTRVGLMGTPFEGMDDIRFSETLLNEHLKVEVIDLPVTELVSLLTEITDDEVSQLVKLDGERFDIDSSHLNSGHTASAKMALALEDLIHEKHLDAFTFNFQELLDHEAIPTLPFHGINCLMACGMGYAGEGDVLTAALMSQMNRAFGSALFCEMFTTDYKKNRILMSHMAELNPAFAKRGAKARMISRPFWAKGVEPFTGPVFALEAQEITLLHFSQSRDDGYVIRSHEARIADEPSLAKLDCPHWFCEVDGDVADFLTRYSRGGGGHHLLAVPGHVSDLVALWAEYARVEHVDLSS